jgi:phosphate:Na+ symporter
MDGVSMTINIVGGLALFLFGMMVMAEGLQKVAGDRMRSVLSVMTTNRVAGVGTGMLVTAVIQSSSATTVMLVGFVNAGLMTLSQSIGVIMGANIGTTMTAWLVAILGFKVDVAAMALPAVALGFIPRLFGARKLGDWGEVLIGFGVLFLGLDFMKEAVAELKDSPEIISWIAGCRADSLLPRLAAMSVGLVVTCIIQSSSAAMAVTMTMAAEGIIDLPTACALALGQNIGTTITANLAAIGTSRVAKQSARAHFLFNALGSIWPILLFSPFMVFIDAIVPGVIAGEPSKLQIATFLAAFHTAFNVANTVVFLPFTKQLAWLSTKLVWGARAEGGDHLVYLDPKLVSSPPMALHAARSELKRMIEEVESMLSKVRQLIASPDKKMGRIADEILASEQVVDMLEREISEYLVSVTRMDTSLEQSHEIAGIIHAVSDVERMGDHCESLLKLARRRYDNKLEFSESASKELADLGERAQDFLGLIREHMFVSSERIMVKAREFEDSIDEMRKRARDGHIRRLNEQECSVNVGLVYIDMLTSFEKIGDHSFNVAQMLAGER